MRSWFLFAVGLATLAINKIRYAAHGYIQPKPFSSADAPRAVAYGVSVVDKWETALREYLKTDTPFAGQRILELGPGSDMSVGAILLDRGAASYLAFDRNPLMTSPDDAFVAELSKHTQFAPKIDEVRFKHDSTFNVATLSANGPFTLVVSQAAFEHFDDPQSVIKHLPTTTNDSRSAVLCAEIDLKTHSRPIVDWDPNNIYRFPEWLYRMLYYVGIPNRVRPEQYVAFLREAGWTDIQVKPLRTVPSEGQPQFGSYDLHVLECLILARRP